MDTHMLSQTPLFREIPEEELPELLSGFEAYTRTYGRGDIIYSAGERIACMGLVIKGSVNIVVNYYWGNSNIFSHIAPGQVFAETYAFCHEPMMVDAVAAEDCAVLFLDFNILMEESMVNRSWQKKLLKSILHVSMQKNLALSSRIFCTAPKTIRGRLLTYLSAQSMKTGSSTFDIPFNRQQLADYLNLDRSALSKELGKMRDEGLLEFYKNTFKLKG